MTTTTTVTTTTMTPTTTTAKPVPDILGEKTTTATNDHKHS